MGRQYEHIGHSGEYAIFSMIDGEFTATWSKDKKLTESDLPPGSQWAGRFDPRLNTVSVKGGPSFPNLPRNLMEKLTDHFPGARPVLFHFDKDPPPAAVDDFSIPPAPYDCIYRGAHVGRAPCRSCGGAKKKAIYTCTSEDVEQDHCTVRAYGRDQPEAICLRCDHRREPPVDWIDPAILEKARTAMNEPPKNNAADWQSKPAVRQAHRLAASVQAASREEPPESLEGRGIVTLAGGKYFTCAYVLCRLLRDLGCELPIQWWYLDWREMDPKMKRMAEEIPGVTTVDASNVLDKKRIMAGWQLKGWAIANSGFEEVLFLDSDQVPTADPTYLFETEEYLATGAILWPDFVGSTRGHDITAQAFEDLSLAVPGKETFKSYESANQRPKDYTPTETGQILINIEKCWDELRFVNWMSEHSDFWYGHGQQLHYNNWLMYGDKSTYYLAWHKLGTEYARPPACTWIGKANDDIGGCFQQKDFEGKTVFQHRCQPTWKYRLHGVNLHAPEFVHGDKFDRYIEELREIWDGKIWSPLLATKEKLAANSGRFILFRGDRKEHIELRPNGTTTRLDGVTHWTTIGEGSEERIVLGDGRGGESWLGRTPSGAGWENHQTDRFLAYGPPPGWKMELGRTEIGMFEAITHADEYGVIRHWLPGPVVVDVGGHVGIFSDLIHRQGQNKLSLLQIGPPEVFCVEPDPKNLADLRHNLRKWAARTTIIPMALGDQLASPELLKLAPKRHTGEKQLHHGPGGPDVVTIGLDSIIRFASNDGQRRVNLLKIDCEGGEWPGLFSANDLGLVDIIVGEYHLGDFTESTPEWAWTSRHRKYNVDMLRQLLIDNGFRPSIKPNPAVHDGLLGNFQGIRCDNPATPFPVDRLIFLHVPKTGGTSLNAVLAKTVGLWPRARPHDDWTQTADDSLALMILRDPMERMISHYNHAFTRWEHQHNIPDAVAWIKSRPSLAEFMARPEIDHIFHNAFTRVLAGKAYHRRAEPLTDADLALARRRLAEMFWYGDFADLEDSTQTLSNLLGVDIALPHFNPAISDVRITAADFTAEDLAAVADRNRADIELYKEFRYEKAGPGGQT